MKCSFRVLVFCNVSLIHALKLSAPNIVQDAAGAAQAGQGQESHDVDTVGFQDDGVDSQAGNRIQDKTVVKFCKTVAATAPFLMPILVLFVSVSLLRSVTDTMGTKIGIKNGAVAATVLKNFITVLF